MAEENQVAPQPAAEGSKKIIIIAIAAVLLGIGLGAVAVFFLVGGSQTDPQSEVEQTSGVQNAAAAPDLPPVRSIYYQFEKAFIVNVEGRKRQHHLMVDITISAKKQQDLDVLAKHLPVIKSNLNQVFDGKDLYVLQTQEGRENLHKAATDAVQSFIAKETGAPSDARVLFTSFVMQ